MMTITVYVDRHRSARIGTHAQAALPYLVPTHGCLRGRTVRHSTVRVLGVNFLPPDGSPTIEQYE